MFRFCIILSYSASRCSVICLISVLFSVLSSSILLCFSLSVSFLLSWEYSYLLDKVLAYLLTWSPCNLFHSFSFTLTVCIFVLCFSMFSSLCLIPGALSDFLCHYKCIVSLRMVWAPMSGGIMTENYGFLAAVGCKTSFLFIPIHAFFFPRYVLCFLCIITTVYVSWNSVITVGISVTWNGLS